MSTPVPGCALVVEDHDSLRRGVARTLETLVERVYDTPSVTDGLRLMHDHRPGLVVTDIRLPDGSGLEIARAGAAQAPVSTVVVISGEATPQEAFRLAQLGVRGYLSKPIKFDELVAVVRRALSEPPELEPFLRATVGHVELQTLEESVRRTLLDEALTRSQGKKATAATLLNVSRQLLQYMLRGAKRPG